MGTPGARKKLCPVSSLGSARLGALDESWLAPDGSFNPERLPDCDLFCAGGIAAAAGFGNVKKFWRNHGSDPRFHTHAITTPDGKVIGRATCTASAVAFGELVRAEGAARRQANLMKGPPSHERSAALDFVVYRTT